MRALIISTGIISTWNVEVSTWRRARTCTFAAGLSPPYDSARRFGLHKIGSWLQFAMEVLAEADELVDRWSSPWVRLGKSVQDDWYDPELVRA